MTMSISEEHGEELRPDLVVHTRVSECEEPTGIEAEAINAVRFLAVDAVENRLELTSAFRLVDVVVDPLRDLLDAPVDELRWSRRLACAGAEQDQESRHYKTTCPVDR